MASAMGRRTAEAEPARFQVIEGPINPPGRLIRFLNLEDGQAINSNLTINNLPHDKWHFSLIKYQKDDTGDYREIDSLRVTSGVFQYALVWFEREMQRLTNTRERATISGNGTDWQLRQIQRFRQLREGLPTDTLKMAEIATRLGRMKTQLSQPRGNPYR
jgi:hypothetical protein